VSLVVSDVIRDELHAVGPDDPLDRAARLFEQHRLRQLPVVDDDRALLGVLSYRPLLRMVARGHRFDAGTRVSDFIEQAASTVADDAALADAVRIMIEEEVPALPVVRAERVVGTLTEYDLLDVVARLLGGRGPD
jgi:predicted transcriptional regulator